MALLVTEGIPGPSGEIKCSTHYCGVTESDHESKKDDLLVCTKHSCKKKHIVFCRGCMESNHRRTDHKLDKKHKQYFPFYKDWLNISTVKANTTDSTARKLGKSGAKNVAKAGTGAMGCYAMLDPKVWKSIKALQGLSPKQIQAYCQGLTNTIEKASEVAAKGSKMTLVKNVAKGQIAVNVFIFVVECGCHLVNYKYYGNISRDEFVRRCKKSGFANTVSCASGIIGGSIGGLFGPWGMVIGATVGGMAGDYFARDTYDKMSPNVEEKFIATAIRRFGYGDMKADKLVKDKEQFNLEVLQAKYHYFARYHHPNGDKNHMNDMTNKDQYSDEEKQEKWVEFYSMYDALLTLLKERNEKIYKSQKKVQ